MGATPLGSACTGGNAEVAAALLDGGANINLGKPPSHWVRRCRMERDYNTESSERLVLGLEARI
jgi:hypothetical protein